MNNWPFNPLVPRSYDLIMIDPPWRFKTRSVAGITEKGAEGQYRCMSMQDITALPVRDLAAKDCLLWCWATNPMIDQQLEIVKGWGFRFATLGTWGKTTRHGKLAFGTGYVMRCASELVIIGKIGNPLLARNVRSLFMAEVREHSRKPDEAYAIAEQMVPGATRRADVFARESRAGWESWGDEADKFDEVAA